MAPNIALETACEPSDIRVPPIFITESDVLTGFPELLSTLSVTNVPDDNPSLPSQTHVSPDKMELLRHETVSSPNLLNRTSSYPCDTFLQNESFSKADVTENQKYSIVSDTADDLFDTDFVLPAQTNWWQLSPEIEDIHQVEDGDCEVVHVPQFGDSLSNSDLWEDVDTFVSVVDLSYDDDVFETERVQEPVYRMDTRVTTVWGLDIIWEEEEE